MGPVAPGRQFRRRETICTWPCDKSDEERSDARLRRELPTTLDRPCGLMRQRHIFARCAHRLGSFAEPIIRADVAERLAAGIAGDFQVDAAVGFEADGEAHRHGLRQEEQGAHQHGGQ